MDFFNVLHRIPGCEESDGQHSQEDYDKIGYLHVYRIGAYDKAAVSRTQGDQSESDLQPAHDGTERQSKYGTDK